MNIIEKIKRSWWIILSFIIFLNGFGFVYVGFNRNNKYWVLEGIIYEIPWVLSLIYAGNDLILEKLIIFALIVLLISIVRSIWVAVKLADVYDNEEKYTIRPTVVNNYDEPNQNNNFLSDVGCCLCIIAIFMIFVVMTF